MKATFFCVEVHGGGAWKRFDFTIQGVGKDVPQGTAVLYATDPKDYLAFVPGKMYDASFAEVALPEKAHVESKVREEPEASGIRISGKLDREEGGRLEGEGGRHASGKHPESGAGSKESEPEAQPSAGVLKDVEVEYVPKPIKKAEHEPEHKPHKKH